MLEKDLNHDLVNLFNTIGWAYKIPDPGQESACSSGKRPFDGFAYFEGWGDFYFESKLSKHKLEAFSLDRVEEHQYKNLLELKRLGAKVGVILGFWVPRKEYCFFVFDPEFLNSLKGSRKSILGKELRWYKDNDFTINLKAKQSFTPDLLFRKCIKKLPEEVV